MLRRLLAAAPLLRVLECDAVFHNSVALPLFRNEPPFEAVRLRSMTFSRRDDDQPNDAAALAEAVVSHQTLTRLDAWDVPLTGAPLDALVQLAISRPFSQCHLNHCGLTGESLPSLTRLLREGSLEEFGCSSNHVLFTGQHVVTFCLALRTCVLKSLALGFTRLFDSLPDGLAVLDALVGHPTLQTLILNFNSISKENKVTVGEALGRLVAADSALQSLDVSFCHLGDDALRPLFAAVAQSTRLRELRCTDNDLSLEFAGDVVLPAIRSNVSLRSLMIAEETVDSDEDDVFHNEAFRTVLGQAEELVSQR
jgi:hypothetical protein